MTEEQAKDIRHSRMWKHITQELDYRINAALLQLKDCAPDKFLLLQQKIHMLEEIKHLPDSVAERESVSD